MKREPIELGFDRAHDFRVAMSEREDAEAAQAIYKLAPPQVAHETAFALPFDYSAFNIARVRPAIQIEVKILYALAYKLCLLFRRERGTVANLHRIILIKLSDIS